MINSQAAAERNAKTNTGLDVAYAKLEAEFTAYKGEHPNLWTSGDLVMGGWATYALPKGTYTFSCDVEGLSDTDHADLQAFVDDSNYMQALNESLTEKTSCTLEVYWDAPTIFMLSGSELVSCKNIKLVRID
jgi:hypothetical protein